MQQGEALQPQTELSSGLDQMGPNGASREAGEQPAASRKPRRRRLAHRRQYTKSRRLASSYLRSHFVRYEQADDKGRPTEHWCSWSLQRQVATTASDERLNERSAPPRPPARRRDSLAAARLGPATRSDEGPECECLGAGRELERRQQSLGRQTTDEEGVAATSAARKQPPGELSGSSRGSSSERLLLSLQPDQEFISQSMALARQQPPARAPQQPAARAAAAPKGTHPPPPPPPARRAPARPEGAAFSSSSLDSCSQWSGGAGAGAGPAPTSSSPQASGQARASGSVAPSALAARSLVSLTNVGVPPASPAWSGASAHAHAHAHAHAQAAGERAHEPTDSRPPPHTPLTPKSAGPPSRTQPQPHQRVVVRSETIDLNRLQRVAPHSPRTSATGQPAELGPPQHQLQQAASPAERFNFGPSVPAAAQHQLQQTAPSLRSLQADAPLPAAAQPQRASSICYTSALGSPLARPHYASLHQSVERAGGPNPLVHQKENFEVSFSVVLDHFFRSFK